MGSLPSYYAAPLLSKRNHDGRSCGCSRCKTRVAHLSQQCPWTSTKLKDFAKRGLIAYSNSAGEIKHIPHKSSRSEWSRVTKLTASLIEEPRVSICSYFLPFVSVALRWGAGIGLAPEPQHTIATFALKAVVTPGKMCYPQ